MGPVLVYLVIATSFIAGLVRPKWGIAGYLFLLYLQPDWNWRWTGLYGLQYQKYLVIATGIGLVIHGIGKNPITGWRSLSFGALLFFVFWTAVSYSVTDVPSISAVYFDVLWKTVFVTYLIAKLVEEPKDALIVAWAIVLGSGYNAFRINEDYFITGVTRYVNNSWGYKGDSNVYTLFTFPPLILSTVLFFKSKSIYLRILAGVITCLHVHQLMLLESRGGLLGAGLSILIILLLVKKTAYTNLAIGLGVAVTVALAGPPVMKEFSSIFASEEERDSSAASRFVLWKAAVQITLDNPILGVGPNATQLFIPKYAVEYSDLDAKHPHNFILEIASGTGVPGAISVLLFLLIPYFAIVFSRRKLALCDPSYDAMFLFSLSMLPGFALASLFAGGGMIESIYFGTGLTFSLFVREAMPCEHAPDDQDHVLREDILDGSLVEITPVS